MLRIAGLCVPEKSLFYAPSEVVVEGTAFRLLASPLKTNKKPRPKMVGAFRL